MATQVWKYDLGDGRDPDGLGETVVAMPKGAWVLTAQFQERRMDGTLNDPSETPGSVWAVVDPAEPMEDRKFHVVGSGLDLPSPGPHAALRWVGTYQIGPVALHVFEEVIEQDVPGWVEFGAGEEG